ncbi:MAG: S-layer homology domain-containing protein, partial [Acidimicrobiia bacterium]
MSRWLVAGLALTLIVGVLGGGVADASNPGNNGRLVYAGDVKFVIDEDDEEHGFEQFAPEIFTMNPDGSDMRRLTFNAGQVPTVNHGDWWLSSNYSPVWSPLGDMIAYVHLSSTDEYSIRLLDPEGRPLGIVAAGFGPATSIRPVLSWSPDAGQLAFLNSHGSLASGLWVVDIDGTNPRLILEETHSSNDPLPLSFRDVAWSPRGDLIAFTASSSATPGWSVWVVAPDGTGLRAIESGADRCSQPEWSPDGDALYCSSWQLDSGLGDIWRTGMPLGSSSSQVASFVGTQAQPTASPDGQDLLFVSEAGGEEGLWKLDPLIRLADFSGAHLDWQPIQGSFWDDERSVFISDIEWMAANGITKGCNPPLNDKYCPDGAVTRGQMAAFLVRALGLTDQVDDPFTDDDSSVFEADIEKLAAAGITKGCNPPANDRFCPDSKVTRAQMAAFLVRALGYTDNGGGNLFVDDDDSIFEADIDRLGTAGVTKG